ncbi:MAG: hypothetical protein EOO65_03685 [Methanosarcinales archaeon]|nr:MAG: hypothetical protein EOO65_03685 [Methanosarcinales archaeon]
MTADIRHLVGFTHSDAPEAGGMGGGPARAHRAYLVLCSSSTSASALCSLLSTELNSSSQSVQSGRRSATNSETSVQINTRDSSAHASSMNERRDADKTQLDAFLEHSEAERSRIDPVLLRALHVGVTCNCGCADPMIRDRTSGLFRRQCVRIMCTTLRQALGA